MTNTSFLSPRFRSRPFGHRHLTAGAIVKIGLLTWLAPAALGLVLVAIAFPFISDSSPALFQAVAGMGGLLIFSPIYGILAVPLALLLGAWAMRFGLAGWGIAMLAALFLPTALGALFQLLDPTAAALGAMMVLTPFVIIHAAVLWCATRLIAPHCLLTPDQ